MEAVSAAAVAAHVVFGSLWLGKDFFGELVLLPSLKAVRSAGELQPYQALLAKDRAWDIPVALGTFLTGLVLLVIQYGTLDPSALWQLPRARPILIALVVVLALVLYGSLVVGPNGRRSWPRTYGQARRPLCLRRSFPRSPPSPASGPSKPWVSSASSS